MRRDAAGENEGALRGEDEVAQRKKMQECSGGK